MIKLSSALQLSIMTEAEKAYPDECCGIILGKLEFDGSKSAESLITVDNARENSQRYHRFEITAEDIKDAEQKARKQGKDLIAFYHSHPDHPAVPSDYDREHALPFYSYIIVSVEKGKAIQLTSWELTEDRIEFRKEEVKNGG
ncbi:MAG: M67 family metallopeptidase [Spirochaetaceae bacterium]|jgi:proteasome lid subunit RPN8/RPN11|nr:M67 family metallopeptidase [Spirochaetaceae bacterium]